MEETRLADLRRRADDFAARDDPALAAAGRTMRSLVDAIEGGEPVDSDRLARIRERAQQAATRGSSADLRAAGRTVLALADAAAEPRELRPPLPLRRAGRRTKIAAAAIAGAAVVAVAGAAAAQAFLPPDLHVDGPRDGALLGSVAAAHVAFVADDTAERWTLDGRDVSRRVRSAGGQRVYAPVGLRDGKHRVEVVSRATLGLRRTRQFDLTVDTKPPALRLVHAAVARAWEPLTVRGTAPGAAQLVVDGRLVPLHAGRFTIRRGVPVPRALTVVARDAAGNAIRRRVAVSLVPRTPAVELRGAHVTFYAWADRDLHAGVMRLIDEHRINAVELDLKDESGLVGFAADAPLARRAGAVRPIYDLAAAVRQLHARGIRVVGRLVCFRDPVLASSAWKAGRRDEVIQTPSHTPYAGYGGFTNFANPAVRRYQIEIAVAAARLGVDDVLYDYVRRPDGPIASMVFPGLRGPPEGAIVKFLEESRRALGPYGTYLGASVFGVAATRPNEVAQPIRRMAAQVDYVAPMVYPSHWAPGEYDVGNPNAQPYDIVLQSLKDFRADVAGSGARVVPWLQDFSLGVTYGPTEVRAQITAARRDGIGEFLLWDPSVTYTADALEPNAPRSKVGLARARTPPTSRRAAPTVTQTAGRPPNELGQIPVIMHHEVRPDRVGAYDQTPAEFRAELERLWREGYWPVTARDLAERRLGSVPTGRTPVVLTFDDATQYQLRMRKGVVDPSTAMGVMLQFARTHHGFRPTGTFYVLREPFGGFRNGPALLRWLVRRGFELGNHTRDHVPLNTLAPEAVQRELALGADVITSAVRGYRVRTMSLPLGAEPSPQSLARHGSWHGRAYGPYGVMLVGAGPAPSPWSRQWDPGAIPRIRSSHAGWNGERDYSASYWLHELAEHPETRYVSDGDPAHLTFPRERMGDLAPRFRARARPF